MHESLSLIQLRLKDTIWTKQCTLGWCYCIPFYQNLASWSTVYEDSVALLSFYVYGGEWTMIELQKNFSQSPCTQNYSQKDKLSIMETGKNQ